VDVDDPCAIARRLQPLLTERTLRRELQARGRARLSAYGWDRSAERFAQVLEQAAACSEPALSAA
jgi:glycosyltransferase involved in cell wall biosynthesis